MDDASVLISFISFLNSVLLMGELCCKLMLKYDIQRYFQNFTKILSKNL